MSLGNFGVLWWPSFLITGNMRGYCVSMVYFAEKRCCLFEWNYFYKNQLGRLNCETSLQFRGVSSKKALTF